MSLSPDHLLVHGFYLSYAVLPRLYWKRVCWTGVCLYITECWLAAGGDDDAVDVSADVGWSHAAASDTETETTVDRQTYLLSYNSWSCELYSNTQHTSRWWRQGQLLLDIARWHKGRPMYDLIRLLLCKKMGGWWRWTLPSPDGVAPSRMVCVSATVNLPLHHRVQKFSGIGSPRWSRKNGHKTVVVWCGGDVAM